MLQKVIHFLKNPVCQEDEHLEFGYRITIFFQLLGLGLFMSFVLGMCIGVLESALELDLGKHASEELLEKYSTLIMVLVIVVLAPVLEELFFRGPLRWFKNKSYFKYVYYLSIITFGAVHLTNFETYENALWVAPLLVAPQLCLGMFLGYIRVRFNLLWAIGLHAAYNFVLTIPIIILRIFDIPIT